MAKAAPPRRILVAMFPDAQILDITGPMEVFSTANREKCERSPGTAEPYALELVSTSPGPVRTSSGLEIVAAAAVDPARGPVDTLVIAGGDGTEAAMRDEALVTWIQQQGPAARRLASVCTGAFLLARAGLLDGKRATTHWRNCALLARAFPEVRVESDPIFVRDGRTYSSAGVCAGMDLALALVEEDLGRDLALSVARRLVVFLKRPGGQSQFSAQLRSQMAQREPLRDLQNYIVENPEAELGVDALARHVAMSPRNFARVFQREVGATPARFVEEVRIEAARRRLEESDSDVEQVAASCGFGTAETLRRAFVRRLRVSPSGYRERFRGPGPRRSGAPDEPSADSSDEISNFQPPNFETHQE